MAIAENIVATIGNTPLIRLNKLTEGLDAEICVKAEFFNPLFSVKDRIGKAMIEAAEKDGSLKPGGLIIEPTSGKTDARIESPPAPTLIPSASNS